MLPICLSCWHIASSAGDYTEVHAEPSGVSEEKGGMLPKIGLVGANPVKPFDPSALDPASPKYAGGGRGGMPFVERPKSHNVKTWPDGSRYEGQWVDGKAHNFGKLRHADGDEYEGQWVVGKAHGQGTYKGADGTIFRGQWENDVKEGQGVEMWSDGARYEGHYAKGRKSGSGTFVWPNGSSYFGQFEKDEFHGEGSYHATDGRHYSGMWREGQMWGKGCYRFPDGRVYEGEYRESLRHGHGVFIWEDGRRYEGQWERDQEHGRGTWISPKGEIKHGTWKNGKISRWDNPKDNIEYVGLPSIESTANQGTTMSRPGIASGSSTQKSSGLEGGANSGNAQSNAYQSNTQGKQPEENIIAAFKEAVTPQMVDYKDNRRLQLVSAVSQQKLQFEEAVIQHSPVSLEDLIKGFLRENNMRMDQVQVQKTKASLSATSPRQAYVYVLEDQNLLQRWLMYHLVHAHYEIVSVAEARQAGTYNNPGTLR